MFCMFFSGSDWRGGGAESSHINSSLHAAPLRTWSHSFLSVAPLSSPSCSPLTPSSTRFFTSFLSCSWQRSVSEEDRASSVFCVCARAARKDPGGGRWTGGPRRQHLGPFFRRAMLRCDSTLIRDVRIEQNKLLYNARGRGRAEVLQDVALLRRVHVRTRHPLRVGLGNVHRSELDLVDCGTSTRRAQVIKVSRGGHTLVRTQRSHIGAGQTRWHGHIDAYFSFRSAGRPPSAPPTWARSFGRRDACGKSGFGRDVRQKGTGQLTCRRREDGPERDKVFGVGKGHDALAVLLGHGKQVLENVFRLGLDAWPG